MTTISINGSDPVLVTTYVPGHLFADGNLRAARLVGVFAVGRLFEVDMTALGDRDVGADRTVRGVSGRGCRAGRAAAVAARVGERCGKEDEDEKAANGSGGMGLQGIRHVAYLALLAGAGRPSSRCCRFFSR